MRLLLDTHVLIWLLSDPSKVSEEAKQVMRDLGTSVFVSVITLWEIVIKARVGKLRVRLDAIEHALREQSFDRLPLTDQHLRVLEGLPMHHRDPFDHLLIAQAIAEDLQFVSKDRMASRYPVSLMRC